MGVINCTIKSRSLLLFLLAQFAVASLVAQINWPASQLLPSFPRTAQTQDLIILRDAPLEQPLFSSLKGIVNRKQPRIFSYEDRDNVEGRYTWLRSLGLDYNEISDNWTLIEKYRDEIEGIIVFDRAQRHTMNLATTIAGDRKALVAHPDLVARLTAPPYNLPILEDFRGRFNSKLQVYQYLFDRYWPSLTKRLVVGISPEGRNHLSNVREYATALGTAVIWLDPKIGPESDLLNRFLSSMAPGGIYMGWWPEEGAGITRASNYGIATIPSDFATNLSVHSGMPRTINVKPIPPKPLLRDKLYVAFIISDGDNVGVVEHGWRKQWDNPDRGSVPIGWTMSPAMVDLMPGALNWYHQNASANDNIISGPSGYGYVYPNFFPNQNTLNQFVAKTAEYSDKAGMRVTTVWNTITGGIDGNVGDSYAQFAPKLLGVTAQNTGGGLSIYRNSLPGLALQCNYCGLEQSMLDHIGYGSEGWDRNSPRFILIQAQPWKGANSTTFKNVANSLNGDYEVVRPDHLFQLLRESRGLPVNPGGGSTPRPDYVTWNSHNFPNRSIRHSDSRARIDPDVTPAAAADWEMVPGLAGKGVSFRSRNFPNRYLRHRFGEVWMDPFENNGAYKASASWYVRDGLADAAKTSFESVNFPGNFIRHKNSLLFSEAITDGGARNDATFFKEGAPDPSNDNNSGFSTQIEAERFVASNAVQTQACSEGGQNVGYLEAGSWLVWDVNIPANGAYKVEYRVASPSGGGKIQLERAGGTQQYGTVDVPNTGGWQTWRTVSHQVNLSRGQQQIAIYVPTAGFNLNWLKISSAASVAGRSDSVDEVVLYPNPVSSALHVGGLSEQANVKAFDVTGGVVLERLIQVDESIDVANLPSGTYQLQIESSAGRIVKRFVKYPANR